MRRSTILRGLICGLVVWAASVVFAGAQAAQLVMFTRAGCVWCARWEQQIGPIYPKTEVGHRAPLRVVDLDRERDAGVQLKSPVRYTPTFVLIDTNREVGRIEGYPGEDFFWGLLEGLVGRLPPAPAPADFSPRPDLPATKAEHPVEGPGACKTAC